MNVTAEDAIRSHFLEWSGGFPPDSSFEVFTYVELARLQAYDYDETREFLIRWMEAEWRRGCGAEH
jgi:hypothetical protein